MHWDLPKSVNSLNDPIMTVLIVEYIEMVFTPCKMSSPNLHGTYLEQYILNKIIPFKIISFIIIK